MTEVHARTEAFLRAESADQAQVDDAFGTGLPAGGRKPYAGTTGRGGSKASAEQRALEDSTGVSGARQHAVMSALETAGALGMTWKELAAKEQWHHGQATGALSVLHKSGDIARLATLKRGKSSIYVLPKFTEGRAVAKHGGRVTKGSLSLTADEVRLVEQFIERSATQPSDKPFAISSLSAKALAAILKRALNEVR